jgi:hypothetical protein
MATNFPTSLDSLTNPTGASSLTSPDHAGQHADINDAVEALEAKVGVNGSAVTSSLEYKITNGITSGLNVSSGDLYVNGLTGRVGISTIVPTASLEINTNGMFDPTLVINNVGPSASLIINDEASDSTPFVVDAAGNVGVGTSSPQAKLDVQNSTSSIAMRVTNTGTNYSFFVEDSASTDPTPFIIDASGNVGVGKTPITLLDVNGTARALDYNVGASTKSMPRGIVVNNTATAADATITSEEVQITGSSFTAVAGRVYKITYVENALSSTAACVFTMRIRQTNISGTLLQTASVLNTVGNVFFGTSGICTGIATFSSGTVNLVATLQCSAGTGNAGRTSTQYAFLLVEDLGTL